MPRPLRIHAPGAFYHVTLRSNHRQNTFLTPADRRSFDIATLLRSPNFWLIHEKKRLT
jgi:hypothetical protein